MGKKKKNLRKLRGLGAARGKEGCRFHRGEEKKNLLLGGHIHGEGSTEWY